MSQAQFQQKYGRAPSHAALPVPQQTPQEDLGQKVEGGLDAVFGGKQIGESLENAVGGLAQLPKGGIKGFNDYYQNNQTNTPQLAGDYLKAGSNFIPGAGEGANLATRTAVGAGAGYAMDVGSNLKNNQPAPFTPGAGTAIMGSLPVAGALIAKPATAIVGRLLKGLGSGLSGVSGDTIDKIVNNPEAAQKASQLIAKSGNSKVLEDNARTIINGISGIKKEASQNFGNAMEALKSEDIDPQKFREGIQPVLDKYGISTNQGSNERNFGNVEFSDQKNLNKVSNLVDKLSTSNMDGLSVRNVMKSIQEAKYKTATSDERLSFNAFLNDLHSGVKNAIVGSTDKLTEANQAYHNDSELTDAAQKILGKVKYKNLPEVVNAANKLEKMFSQKGIEPDVVDKFLTRAGINPSEFKTNEAVRQMDNQKDAANSKGLGVGEVMREVTSAVVTPEMVKNVAIATGLAKEKVEPFLSGLAPAVRNAVVQTLLQTNAQMTPQ